MKTYILASKNKNKAREIKEILGEGFDVITQTEAGFGDIDVVEDGKTFEENAAKKAEAIFNASNMPTIADDSGLCVDYLDNAPGVFSARYSGENATDKKNNKKLLDALKDVEFQKRTARFVCVIAVKEPSKDIEFFRGECEGYIDFEEKGNEGFGYDPLFYVAQYDKTMGELEAHIKNVISHRYLALKKFAKAQKKV